MARDRGLIDAAVESGLEERHFRDDALRCIYVSLLLAGDGEPALDEDVSDVWGALVSDEMEVVHPREAFDETVRRMVHRAKLDRLTQIDREMELADEDQARRLLVEKEEVARELRGAGVALSFLRRYSETAPA
jgi:hypothetical protein